MHWIQASQNTASLHPPLSRESRVWSVWHRAGVRAIGGASFYQLFPFHKMYYNPGTGVLLFGTRSPIFHSRGSTELCKKKFCFRNVSFN